MYNATQYLNYNDLNDIETKIYDLTELVKTYDPSIPDFVPKTWALNEFPYIQEIDRIEKGVQQLGEYWYKPYGWQNHKIWLTGLETEQVIKSFSYIDINRWLIDLTLIENSLGDETTIWNVQSYIDWNVVSNIDWESE